MRSKIIIKAVAESLFSRTCGLELLIFVKSHAEALEMGDWYGLEGNGLVLAGCCLSIWLLMYATCLDEGSNLCKDFRGLHPDSEGDYGWC